MYKQEEIRVAGHWYPVCEYMKHWVIVSVFSPPYPGQAYGMVDFVPVPKSEVTGTRFRIEG